MIKRLIELDRKKYVSHLAVPKSSAGFLSTDTLRLTPHCCHPPTHWCSPLHHPLSFPKWELRPRVTPHQEGWIENSGLIPESGCRYLGSDCHLSDQQLLVLWPLSLTQALSLQNWLYQCSYQVLAVPVFDPTNTPASACITGIGIPLSWF